ncbi:Translocon at the outer membrane of chloroplasts 64, partial [Ananas comosus]
QDDGILVLPTVLGLPPKLNSREISSEGYNLHTLCLTAVASMSGCCQVTVPLGLYEKCPVSVSFIARNGGDCFLLDTIQTMYSTLQEQIDVVQKSSVSSTSASKEESAEIAKEKGNLAYKEKQWQKAINLYTEAIKLNGKNATYYSNRAAAYLELGSYRQAEADCTSAINLEKKNVKAYLRRGTAREMLGYYKEAVEDFKYALVLEPTNKTANLAVNRLNKLFQ